MKSISFSITRVNRLRRAAERARTIGHEDRDPPPVGGPPDGWSVCTHEADDLLRVFDALRLRAGFALHAYVFRSGGNGNGIIWAVPADAPLLAPSECPTIEDTWLQPPRPPRAVPLMQAIEGDGSPWSYLSASILRREAEELGALWHGCVWSDQTILSKPPRQTDGQSESGDGWRLGDAPVGNWTWREAVPRTREPTYADMGTTRAGRPAHPRSLLPKRDLPGYGHLSCRLLRRQDGMDGVVHGGRVCCLLTDVLREARRGPSSGGCRPGAEGGLALALKGDTRFTRTASRATKDAGGGKLEAAEADVWLVRAGIEGSRRFALGAKASLTPSVEVGLRLDGGDAETGFGTDLGGGLALGAPEQGLALDLKARGLVAHEASGFREWGASASLTWDPRPDTDRGLALTLRQSWGGSPAGGMDALLGRETLAGLTADDNASAGSGRLEAELGYGIAMFGGGFTGTPYLGFALSDTSRDYRLGWRLKAAERGGRGLALDLQATRRERADGNREHGVMLVASIRW